MNQREEIGRLLLGSLHRQFDWRGLLKGLRLESEGFDSKLRDNRRLDLNHLNREVSLLNLDLK